MRLNYNGQNLYQKMALPEGAKAPTVEEMFNKVYEFMKTMPEYKEQIDSLDYALAYDRERVLIPQCESLSVVADVNTGGAEGIYIDCALRVQLSEAVQHIKLGTFKTLEEDIVGYAAMGTLSGIFIGLAEIYLWSNHEKFDLDSFNKLKEGRK